VLVTERGGRDDAPACDAVHQQQCLAHRQGSLSEGLETQHGRARDCGEQRKAQRQEALAWWPTSREGPVTACKVAAEALQREVTDQRRDRRLQDADNQRRLHALGWHHDRGTLVRFGADPRIEPTTKRAERALRPAVIARNVSQGSKNERGAHPFAAFTRVVRTLAKQGAASLLERLYHLCRSPSVQGLAS
jgi:hypothetical protein